MGKKNRRARLARGVQHMLHVGTLLHTEMAHDPEWLLGQLKAAVRVARDMDKALTIYEENFRDDVREAVLEALSSDDRKVA